MNKRLAQDMKDKESLTPEEILARGKRAKLRFRSAIRFVIQNLYWLTDVEDDQLGDDVHKNILVLTKKKGLLTLKEKALLNKPAEYRTDEEKQRLGKKISGLKCFRRYPANVKKQLSGVTYFYYYGPGRTVVREGHESNALYFIITGEVTIHQNFYDPIKENYECREIGTMKAGNIFGEITLLHDIPRTSTIISQTNLELLCLKKEDFNLILKATIQQQWDEIKKAMTYFTYFDDWDTNIIRDACILGKLKTFRPQETVLGDGYGYAEYTYFICSGRCQVIEHLMLIPEMRGTRKIFKRYVPPSGESDSDSVEIDANNAASLMVKERKVRKKRNAGDETDEEMIASQSEMTVFNVGKEEALRKDKEHEAKKLASVTALKAQQSSVISTVEKNKEQNTTEHANTTVSSNTSLNKTSAKRSIKALDTTSKRSASAPSNIYLPPHVETYFMQVCILNATACFNVGENLEHRRIVATNPTQCLMIPRYWLAQQNKGNIWNRIQQFLQTHIPTPQQVFKEFFKQRHWMVYRKRVFEDLRAQRNMSSSNDINNVPYFIRINEELPIY